MYTRIPHNHTHTHTTMAAAAAMIILLQSAAASQCGCLGSRCRRISVPVGASFVDCLSPSQSYDDTGHSPTFDCQSSGCSFWISWWLKSSNSSLASGTDGVHPAHCWLPAQGRGDVFGGSAELCFRLTCALGDGRGAESRCGVSYVYSNERLREEAASEASMTAATAAALVFCGVVGCAGGWILLRFLKEGRAATRPQSHQETGAGAPAEAPTQMQDCVFGQRGELPRGLRATRKPAQVRRQKHRRRCKIACSGSAETRRRRAHPQRVGEPRPPSRASKCDG
eukprot:TRINITY_DN4909_c0_g1_i3.p1 TRINITY_DN4909_c0_g1~~TRINITY_DN4909_c0_g1_i3.p1  ORF type:complete len:282 (+),score=40.97 TRINITY_DN4909_c0_g1_i3:46-891(+)